MLPGRPAVGELIDWGTTRSRDRPEHSDAFRAACRSPTRMPRVRFASNGFSENALGLPAERDFFYNGDNDHEHRRNQPCHLPRL